MQSFSILLSFNCSILAHPLHCCADARQHVPAAVCIVFMMPCVAQQLMPVTCHFLTEATVLIAERQIVLIFFHEWVKKYLYSELLLLASEPGPHICLLLAWGSPEEQVNQQGIAGRPCQVLTQLC